MTRANGQHNDEADLVRARYACPNCGEQDCDQLIWIDDDRVECQRCRTVYVPGESNKMA